MPLIEVKVEDKEAEPTVNGILVTLPRRGVDLG